MAHEIIRALIWAKTYPEVSSRHLETVCTAAVREDGSPIRLYPVPLRYLSSSQRFRLYDWIEAPVERNTSDPRPESFRLQTDAIRIVGHLDTADHWRARREIVFRDSSWQFDSLNALESAQRSTKRSMGIIAVRSVEGVRVRKKSRADETEFRRRLVAVHGQTDLFRRSYKDLEFLPYSIQLQWRCASTACECERKPHSRAVLDWGLLELARREGPDAAKLKLEAMSNTSGDALRIFAGNYRLRPWEFGIIGLWYPAFDPQVDLFG